MKRNVPETTLMLLLLVISGCSSSAVVVQEDSSDQDFVSSEAGHETPELALQAFVTAWNSGDFTGVSRTFHPERRGILVSRREDIQSRLSRWRIEEPEVDTLCHPRGGGWKVSRFVRVDTSSEEVVVDAAWLRLGEQKWWMYSL